MRERDLAAACSSWLEGHGFDVFGEVAPRHYGGRFDLVGLRGEDVWIVETKTALSADLRRQAFLAELWGTAVFAGIPWRQRPLPARAGVHGWGVLFVKGGSVFTARAPAPRAEPLDSEHERYVRQTREACSRHHRGFAGGQTAAEGGGHLTPWRVFVWELHRLLWSRESFSIQEAVEAAAPLFGVYAWKNRRTQVWKALAFEKCFAFVAADRYACTGDGVPADCKEGPVPDLVGPLISWRRR